MSLSWVTQEILYVSLFARHNIHVAHGVDLVHQNPALTQRAVVPASRGQLARAQDYMHLRGPYVIIRGLIGYLLVCEYLLYIVRIGAHMVCLLPRASSLHVNWSEDAKPL